MSAFFLPQSGGGLLATSFTSGPWSAEFQHGGPPTALLGRALEGALSPGTSITRLSFEFLRPVPVAELRCEVEVESRGKGLDRLRASLLAGSAVVLRASAVALRDSPTVPRVEHAQPPIPPPDACPVVRFPFLWGDRSYVDAIETRAARGDRGSGDQAAWLRALYPLVDGEPTSPLQRVLLLADAANGVSAPLPYESFTFINPDLTVALLRPLSGPWLLIDSRSSVDERGVGLVDARLADERGYLGRSVQSLLVRPRS